jgi:oligopeptide transport system permease protein
MEETIKNNDVELKYLDSSNEKHDVVLSADKFKFVQSNKAIHDVKFQGRPTTFLRDAVKRFKKNKSSVVGFIIIGIIVLLSIIMPLALFSYHSSGNYTTEANLTPKLFDAGTGFWDGTKYYSGIVYDQTNNAPASTNSEAVVDGSLEVYDGTINNANQYASGGYIRIANQTDDESDAAFLSPKLTFSISSGSISITDYVTTGLNTTYGTDNTSYELVLYYNKTLDSGEISSDSTELILASDISSFNQDETFNVTSLIEDKTTDTTFNNAQLAIVLPRASENNAIYLKSLVYNVTSTDASFETFLTESSFSDANSCLLRQSATDKTYQWFARGGNVGLEGASIKYCNFRFDTYENVYGKEEKLIGQSDLDALQDEGVITYTIDKTAKTIDIKVLNEDKCYIDMDEPMTVVIRTGLVTTVQITCTVLKYKEMGYSHMPRHLFGTNTQGYDMVKLVSIGTLYSLLLGVCISTICFLFGLVWGAISGYFGGALDIVMERIVDIINGIPSIVVLTLCLMNMGQTFGVFILAMCMTGWIGTESLTRTQFYRFKRREYVLAARSLGASDNRLIFKHILPNSMGTIITSSVLMVPSVIFSEASLAYLGLGFKDITSLGTILNDNQIYISTSPYLLVFPAIILALLMISFNLFGNGLRDAFNPSLKGAD